MTDHWNESLRRRYACRRVAAPLDLLGDEADAGWDDLPWSEPFSDITGSGELEPRFRTRMRMGWDDQYLYVNAKMEEPHVWGTITEQNAVMFEDNDFEIFIDPDRDGLWEITLRLEPGEFAYQFVLDGDRWISDPSAIRFEDDGFGGRNARLTVGGDPLVVGP